MNTGYWAACPSMTTAERCTPACQTRQSVIGSNADAEQQQLLYSLVVALLVVGALHQQSSDTGQHTGLLADREQKQLFSMMRLLQAHRSIRGGQDASVTHHRLCLVVVVVDGNIGDVLVEAALGVQGDLRGIATATA